MNKYQIRATVKCEALSQKKKTKKPAYQKEEIEATGGRGLPSGKKQCVDVGKSGVNNRAHGISRTVCCLWCNRLRKVFFSGSLLVIKGTSFEYKRPP